MKISSALTVLTPPLVAYSQLDRAGTRLVKVLNVARP
jgi:hypothetical protein